MNGQMRLKMLWVSCHLLLDLLRADGSRVWRISGLPDDAEIVRHCYDFNTDRYGLVIRSLTFPEVPEGALLLTLDLIVSAADAWFPDPPNFVSP